MPAFTPVTVPMIEERKADISWIPVGPDTNGTARAKKGPELLGGFQLWPLLDSKEVMRFKGYWHLWSLRDTREDGSEIGIDIIQTFRVQHLSSILLVFKRTFKTAIAGSINQLKSVAAGALCNAITYDDHLVLFLFNKSQSCRSMPPTQSPRLGMKQAACPISQGVPKPCRDSSDSPSFSSPLQSDEMRSRPRTWTGVVQSPTRSYQSLLSAVIAPLSCDDSGAITAWVGSNANGFPHGRKGGLL